jgi:peptidoglycan/LPS O-acetylase OafA/YrhL
MTDDRELAALLGEAPRSLDPGFRFDVLVLTAARARRRASRQRAFRTVAAFTLLGLVIAALQALGLRAEALQPLLLVAGVLGLAYVLALLTIDGPRAALARSRALLRLGA